jgi:hypothetical protein
VIRTEPARPPAGHGFGAIVTEHLLIDRGLIVAAIVVAALAVAAEVALQQVLLQGSARSCEAEGRGDRGDRQAGPARSPDHPGYRSAGC